MFVIDVQNKLFSFFSLFVLKIKKNNSNTCRRLQCVSKILRAKLISKLIDEFVICISRVKFDQLYITFWEIPGEYMDDGDEHPPRNIFDATKMIPMAGKINKQVLNKSIEWSCIFYSRSIH